MSLKSASNAQSSDYSKYNGFITLQQHVQQLNKTQLSYHN